ncbi:MAG: hypothetical protein ACP5RN_00240 [Armatimonadota bacterium]
MDDIIITSGSIASCTMQAIAHPKVGINFDTANISYYNEGVAPVLRDG